MNINVSNNFAFINAIVTNLSLSILGVVFGIITNSSSILFDGMYSALMFLFSISIFVLVQYSKKSKLQQHYPYGMGKIENLLSFLKLIFIITLGAYFCVDSSIMLYNAFNDPTKLPSVPAFEIYIIYISIACAISIYTYIIFKIANKNETSELIKAETKSTMIDFFITFAIGIALIASALFVKGDEQYVTVVRTSIDKSILFLLIIASTPSLVKLLIQNIHILLDRKSNHKLADQIYDFIKYEGIQEVSILTNSNTSCVMIYINKSFVQHLTKNRFTKNEEYINSLLKDKVYIEYIITNV